MKLTTDELKKIADLARIDLTDIELEKFASELEPILDYVAQLKKVDTGDVEYASHVADYKGEVLQEDTPDEMMDPEDTFRNGKNRRKGSHFITSNIQ